MRFPTATIYWKSPNALHEHQVVCSGKGEKQCTDRIKYMSSSRAEFLYRGQKQIMEELGVPFLDLYEGYYLSAEWTEDNDGRHYKRQLTGRMLHWHYDTAGCTCNYTDPVDFEAFNY